MNPRSMTLGLILAALTTSIAATARADDVRRPMIPVLGLQANPSVSVVLPAGLSSAVTDPYGTVHPGGTLALSAHVSQRFALVLDLHAEGWHGQLTWPNGHSMSMRFINYWIHLRARTTLGRWGPIGLLLDASVALGISREDSVEFRSEGMGFSFGVGPMMEIHLGQYLSVSINAHLEPGWIWYTTKSAQARDADRDSYLLSWPRLLVGLALNGYVLHRPDPNALESLRDQIDAEQDPDVPAPE